MKRPDLEAFEAALDKNAPMGLSFPIEADVRSLVAYARELEVERAPLKRTIDKANKAAETGFEPTPEQARILAVQNALMREELLITNTERDNSDKAAASMSADVTHFADLAEDLKQRLESRERALWRYAKHDNACPVEMFLDDTDQCDCGLTNIRRELSTEQRGAK